MKVVSLTLLIRSQLIINKEKETSLKSDMPVGEKRAAGLPLLCLPKAGINFRGKVATTIGFLFLHRTSKA